MEVNTVINGQYVGKKVDFLKDRVYINKSTFGLIDINKTTAKDIEVLSKNDCEQYQIKVLFTSGEDSTIFVDRKIYIKLLEAMKINSIIDGEFKGVEIIDRGSIYIGSDFIINKENIKSIDLISYEEYDEGKIVYTFKVLSVSDKESILYVDDKIYSKLIKIWPEKQKDRLNELLSSGYKIVGYTSYFLGSALGTSTVIGTACARMQRQHNILLQKDTNVELVMIVEECVDGKMVERTRNNLVISPISNQFNKLFNL